MAGVRGDAQGNDRDVEGQEVVGNLAANAKGAGTDTAQVRGDGGGGHQLNLAEEANVAVGQRGTDGLAHVAEDEVSSSTLSGDGGLQARAGGGHHAGDGHLISKGGGGGNDRGGGVISGSEGDLTDETLNGRHLIFRT